MLFHQPHNSRGNYTYNAFIYENALWQPHFHKNFELIYILSGSLNCSVGERSALLTEGNFALCLANEVHSLTSVGRSRCWIGVFSEDFVHAFAKQAYGKMGTDFVFRCAPPIEEFLRENLLNAEAPPLFLLKSCLYAVCAEYSRQIALVPQENKSGVLMRAITDYISAQYKNSITLADMAKTLGYNYHYLSKCFHRIFNMPFPEFLNSYRLDAALALLTESDREIVDIAFASGFGSIRSFNTYFKSRIGTTPAAYRRERKSVQITP